MIRENEDLHGRRNKMNYMKKVANMLGVELGEEFYLKKGNFKYKLVQSGLLFKDGGWYDASITLIELLSGEKEIEWKPKDEEEYYYPSFESENGVDWHLWYGDNHDKKIRNIVGIYKTPEQAQEKAKELGWLE
jgi:hypothetical protein